MGLRGLLFSGWASMPGALKQACRLGAVALLALGFLPSRAAAQTYLSGNCPTSPVSGVVTLAGDVSATAGGATTCITVGSDNTTINLAGFTINVSALGDPGVAIETGTTSNTSIVGGNGTIITNYSSSTASSSSAIDSQGGSNITITGVNIENLPGGSSCENPPNTTPRYDTNWGNGITLQTVTGATIGSDTITCFQYGISVQNSQIPRKSPGSISGNNLTYNVNNMQTSGSGTYSAGLVLSNSSGWSVSGNNIEYNGSADVNSTCAPSTTSPQGIISCSFGLQIIDGSNNNSIENNTVNNNYVGGIYTGPATSKNTIAGNTALNNLPYDLYDDAPAHSNSWHHNTCTNAGGTLSSHTCH